jgi:hypothetical protein
MRRNKEKKKTADDVEMVGSPEPTTTQGTGGGIGGGTGGRTGGAKGGGIGGGTGGRTGGDKEGAKGGSKKKKRTKYKPYPTGEELYIFKESEQQETNNEYFSPIFLYGFVKTMYQNNILQAEDFLFIIEECLLKYDTNNIPYNMFNNIWSAIFPNINYISFKLENSIHGRNKNDHIITYNSNNLSFTSIDNVPKIQIDHILNMTHFNISYFNISVIPHFALSYSENDLSTILQNINKTKLSNFINIHIRAQRLIVFLSRVLHEKYDYLSETQLTKIFDISIICIPILFADDTCTTGLRQQLSQHLGILAYFLLSSSTITKERGEHLLSLIQSLKSNCHQDFVYHTVETMFKISVSNNQTLSNNTNQTMRTTLLENFSNFAFPIYASVAPESLLNNIQTELYEKSLSSDLNILFQINKAFSIIFKRVKRSTNAQCKNYLKVTNSILTSILNHCVEENLTVCHSSRLKSIWYDGYNPSTLLVLLKNIRDLPLIERIYFYEKIDKCITKIVEILDFLSKSYQIRENLKASTIPSVEYFVKHSYFIYTIIYKIYGLQYQQISLDFPQKNENLQIIVDEKKEYLLNKLIKNNNLNDEKTRQALNDESTPLFFSYEVLRYLLLNLVREVKIIQSPTQPRVIENSIVIDQYRFILDDHLYIQNINEGNNIYYILDPIYENYTSIISTLLFMYTENNLFMTKSNIIDFVNDIKTLLDSMTLNLDLNKQRDSSKKIISKIGGISLLPQITSDDEPRSSLFNYTTKNPKDQPFVTYLSSLLYKDHLSPIPDSKLDVLLQNAYPKIPKEFHTRLNQKDKITALKSYLSNHLDSNITFHHGLLYLDATLFNAIKNKFKKGRKVITKILNKALSCPLFIDIVKAYINREFIKENDNIYTPREMDDNDDDDEDDADEDDADEHDKDIDGGNDSGIEDEFFKDIISPPHALKSPINTETTESRSTSADEIINLYNKYLNKPLPTDVETDSHAYWDNFPTFSELSLAYIQHLVVPFGIRIVLPEKGLEKDETKKLISELDNNNIVTAKHLSVENRRYVITKSDIMKYGNNELDETQLERSAIVNSTIGMNVIIHLLKSKLSPAFVYSLFKRFVFEDTEGIKKDFTKVDVHPIINFIDFYKYVVTQERISFPKLFLMRSDFEIFEDDILDDMFEILEEEAENYPYTYAGMDYLITFLIREISNAIKQQEIIEEIESRKTDSEDTSTLIATPPEINKSKAEQEQIALIQESLKKEGVNFRAQLVDESAQEYISYISKVYMKNTQKPIVILSLNPFQPKEVKEPFIIIKDNKYKVCAGNESNCYDGFNEIFDYTVPGTVDRMIQFYETEIFNLIKDLKVRVVFFAYGASGSGKTTTVFGNSNSINSSTDDDDDHDDDDEIPRKKRRKEKKKKKKKNFHQAFLYLALKFFQGHKIRVIVREEIEEQSTTLNKPPEKYPIDKVFDNFNSAEELFHEIDYYERKKRKSMTTSLNKSSSRTHMIIEIVDQNDPNIGIMIVDAAGSERPGEMGFPKQSDEFKTGIFINHTLGLIRGMFSDWSRSDESKIIGAGYKSKHTKFAKSIQKFGHYNNTLGKIIIIGHVPKFAKNESHKNITNASLMWLSSFLGSKPKSSPHSKIRSR